MDNIINKLLESGIPKDTIDKLRTGLGNTFETELVTSGLRAAALKVGIDITDLPDIDFQEAKAGAQELMGKDVDGDGKTGISEAMDSFKKIAHKTDLKKVGKVAHRNATGLFAKIKKFFGK